MLIRYINLRFCFLKDRLNNLNTIFILFLENSDKTTIVDSRWKNNWNHMQKYVENICLKKDQKGYEYKIKI